MKYMNGYKLKKHMQYKASIIGYRTKEHDKLSPEEFLQLYVSSLHKKRFKKNGYQYMRLADFIMENWDDQIKFVKRLFYPDCTSNARGRLTEKPSSFKPDALPTGIGSGDGNEV